MALPGPHFIYHVFVISSSPPSSYFPPKLQIHVLDGYVTSPSGRLKYVQLNTLKTEALAHVTTQPRLTAAATVTEPRNVTGDILSA